MDKIRLDDLIYPLFVKEGIDVREEISSMPGIYRCSPENIAEEAARVIKLGINKIILFGITDKRDPAASGAYARDNVVARSVSLLKKLFPGLTIMTDVCLCAYSSSGHCAILKGDARKGEVSIDKRETLEALAGAAVTHAAAGADYVAPSAMADGQVGYIRTILDKAGYDRTRIMAYSAKFNSAFYGPFRDAAGSAPKFGDRSSYQLDSTAKGAAFEEIAADIAEGADIVMVKPALPYLDIIKEAKDRFSHTLAAYNVSGEYAMVKSAAKAGCLDEKRIVYETIAAIKRAGADLIITYHAADIAKWQRTNEGSDEELFTREK
jgi:porphobilinogen synthase